MKGKDFRKLLENLYSGDNAVVDIGSSNIESLIQAMIKIKDSHDIFDFFVLPVTPIVKQQRDTIATIQELAGIGIPANKIKVIFNYVDMDDHIEIVFKPIFEHHSIEGNFTLNPDAVIHENEIFQLLKESNVNLSINELACDKTDYLEKIKNSADRDEKLRWSRMKTLVGMARAIVDELDIVYAALFDSQVKKKAK